jgi:hypothetical protein
MSSNSLPINHFTSIPKIESYFRHEIIKAKYLLLDAQERLLETEINPARNPKVQEITQRLIQLSILQHQVQIEEFAVTAAREINQYVMWVANEALKEMARTENIYL